MSSLLKAAQRKAAHGKKTRSCWKFTVVIYSATSSSPSTSLPPSALFVFNRAAHEFESNPIDMTDGKSYFWNERVTTQATLFADAESGAIEEKEYTLSLYAAVTTAKGVKRGALFARGRLDLGLYSHARTSKRVVLVLDPHGDQKTSVQCILTVSAEAVNEAGEPLAAPASLPREEEEEEEGEARGSDSEGEAEAAPAAQETVSSEEEAEAATKPARKKKGSKRTKSRRKGGAGPGEEEEMAEYGARAIPVAPPPVEAKAVLWAGAGARAAEEAISFILCQRYCGGEEDPPL